MENNILDKIIFRKLNEKDKEVFIDFTIIFLIISVQNKNLGSKFWFLCVLLFDSKPKWVKMTHLTDNNNTKAIVFGSFFYVSEHKTAQKWLKKLFWTLMISNRYF